MDGANTSRLSNAMFNLKLNIRAASCALPFAKKRVSSVTTNPDQYVRQMRIITAKNAAALGVGAGTGVGSYRILDKLADKLALKNPNSKIAELLSQKSIKVATATALSLGATALTHKATHPIKNWQTLFGLFAK